MGKANHTFVCFDCRKAVRDSSFRQGPTLCPTCGKACYDLGDKVRIPAPSKEQDWETLHTEFFTWHRETAAKQQAVAVQRKHEIERQLNDLENAKPDRAREFLIDKLKDELQTLRHTAPSGLKFSDR